MYKELIVIKTFSTTTYVSFLQTAIRFARQTSCPFVLSAGGRLCWYSDVSLATLNYVYLAFAALV